MKAVTVSEYGARAELTEVPPRPVGSHDVRIRVEAAGMNPMDTSIANGAWASRLDAVFPLILGSDVAGVVESTGADVTAFSAGDRVFGQLLVAPLGSTGTYAEYVVAPDNAPLAPIPESLSATSAAAIPTAGGTAQGIVDQLGDLSGQRVLIIGAAGGVGSYLTQLAASAGATVITVAAASEADRMKTYGASMNIDRAAGDVGTRVREAYPQGINIVIDLANEASTFAGLALAVLTPGGTALSTRFAADPAALDSASITGINFSANITAELLARLASSVIDARVTVPPITTVPLAEVPGLLASTRGSASGKTVITVTGDAD